MTPGIPNHLELRLLLATTKFVVRPPEEAEASPTTKENKTLIVFADDRTDKLLE